APEAAIEESTSAIPQRLLTSVFGPGPLRDAAGWARADLLDRVGLIFDEEMMRFSKIIGGTEGPDARAALQLYQATYALSVPPCSAPGRPPLWRCPGARWGTPPRPARGLLAGRGPAAQGRDRRPRLRRPGVRGGRADRRAPPVRPADRPRPRDPDRGNPQRP